MNKDVKYLLVTALVTVNGAVSRTDRLSFTRKYLLKQQTIDEGSLMLLVYLELLYVSDTHRTQDFHLLTVHVQ